MYTRLNPLARQYVLEKVERRFQYNVTELVQPFNEEHEEIDTWSTLCTQLSQGIMSMIGQINQDDSEWLSGFCSTYQVPFLSLENFDYQSKQFYLSLMPDVLPALIAFLRRYQIYQIVYIYDHIVGARRLNQLIQLQTTNRLAYLNIVSRYLGHPDDSYDLLQNVEVMTHPPRTSSVKVSGRYIVLDFHSFDTYRVVMDKIKHRGMTTTDYHYIFMSLNAKQLDMTYFRYGGVNVTFFAIPSYENSHDQQSINSYHSYLQSIQTAKIESVPSVQSLLIADAWETFLRTINRMLSSANETREKLKVFRQGRFYNGLTPGIDCRSNQIQAWSAGKIYFEHLLNTSFQGLTGNLQFSNETGQRKNYTLDVYRVTRNDMPKHIGFFRAPTTIEVEERAKKRFHFICFS